jgi:hypothetical protein
LQPEAESVAATEPAKLVEAPRNVLIVEPEKVTWTWVGEESVVWPAGSATLPSVAVHGPEIDVPRQKTTVAPEPNVPPMGVTRVLTSTKTNGLRLIVPEAGGGNDGVGLALDAGGGPVLGTELDPRRTVDIESTRRAATTPAKITRIRIGPACTVTMASKGGPGS